MANLTFREIVEAASKLPPTQKAALVQTLQASTNRSPTREALIAEIEALRAAGVFEHLESLRNKYANNALAYLNDEELRLAIREVNTG